MARLASLTEEDIKNGVLNRMLADVGIPNINNYVTDFHQQTASLFVDTLEHQQSGGIDSTMDEISDDDIFSPADIETWLTGIRPRLDDSLTPCASDESSTLPSSAPARPPPPTDLSGWMQRMIPESSLVVPAQAVDTTSTAPASMPSVTGDLGSWLHDWSISIAQQPPPASLDNWLQGLVSDKLTEPIGKGTSAKGRLNSYLDAAQRVLSRHGYKIAADQPTTVVPAAKVGMFGNVKHMYFLVSGAYLVGRTRSFSLTLTLTLGLLSVENLGQESRPKDHCRRRSNHASRDGHRLSQQVRRTITVRHGRHQSRRSTTIPGFRRSHEHHSAIARRNIIGQSLEQQLQIENISVRGEKCKS
jgi:hypothetical protein